MEVVEIEDGSSSSVPEKYTLKPDRINNEDIIFCFDVDSESLVEMKATASNGRPITRLDSVKQSVLLFIHAKLCINPDHRFAFAVLSKSASWLRKEFSSDVDSAHAALRSLSVVPSGGHADLTQLFRLAAHEAKKSRAQNRILRVILIYCRSSTIPQYNWPTTQKLFTLDVMYLHDKPGSDNCPQNVYDSLVVALEHVSEHEAYILESGQGLPRALHRNMCVLLSHPQQRCPQDDIDVPKSLVKKAPVVNAPQTGDEPISA